MSSVLTTEPIENSRLLKKRRSAWTSRLIRLGVGVGALAIFFLVFCIYHEWRASQILTEKLAELRRANQPVDFPSLQAWNRSRTNAEGTKAWQDVAALVISASPTLTYPSLPQSGRGQMDRERVPLPGEPWSAETLVGEALEFLSPVLEAVEVASEFPSSLIFGEPDVRWNFPLYYGSRYGQNLASILALEFEYARYHRDGARGKRALQLMGSAAKAFNQSPFQHEVLQHRLLTLLQESVSDDVWTQHDLKEMSELLASSDTSYLAQAKAAAIQRRVALIELSQNRSEMAWYFRGEFNKLVELMVALPSAQLELLESANHAVELFSDEKGLVDYLNRPFQQNQDHPAHSIILERILPPLDSENSFELKIANTYVGLENQRRFTLTALAIKQYRLKHGKWPDSLEHLEAGGLRRRDYTSVQGFRFGFQVDIMTEQENAFYRTGEQEPDEVAWLWYTTPMIRVKAVSAVYQQPLDIRNRPVPSGVSPHLPLLKIR